MPSCTNVQNFPKCALSKDCLNGFSFYLILGGQTVPYMVKAVNFPQYEYGDQKNLGSLLGMAVWVWPCLSMS